MGINYIGQGFNKWCHFFPKESRVVKKTHEMIYNYGQKLTQNTQTSKLLISLYSYVIWAPELINRPKSPTSRVAES